MRFPAILTSLAVAGSLIAVPAFTAQAQTETEDLSQCKNIQTRVTGGQVNWGLKESFRGYINGPIARGQWTTSGAVTESGENKTAKDFQFIFEVDPEASKVNFDKNGNITGDSVIKTKDSTIIFEGHHGALYTNMSKPYVEVSGTTAKHGVTYLGYYVPGKDMAAYKPEDRTEANKVTGTDSFTTGTASAWEKTGDNTYTLSTTDNKYVPKPGTGYNAATKESTIEGVDVIFMGMYNADYKPEIDNSQITLTTEKYCADVEEPEETTPPTTDNPADPTTNPVDPVTTTTAKPVTTTAKPVTTTAKPVTTTTAKPAKPTASATTTSKPADNGGSANGGFFDSFKGFWNKLLSFGSLFGLIGVLFQAFNSLGWFNVFGSSR